MYIDLKLRRLQQVAVKGNFTINCDTNEECHQIQRFFCTTKSYIKFKDLKNGNREKDFEYNNFNKKFIIKYENLQELLKLREIFNTRASKFDMYLIKKRGYNPFVESFFIKIIEPIKVIKN